MYRAACYFKAAVVSPDGYRDTCTFGISMEQFAITKPMDAKKRLFRRHLTGSVTSESYNLLNTGKFYLKHLLTFGVSIVTWKYDSKLWRFGYGKCLERYKSKKMGVRSTTSWQKKT
jgi:hypothetical protein